MAKRILMLVGDFVEEEPYYRAGQVAAVEAQGVHEGVYEPYSRVAEGYAESPYSECEPSPEVDLLLHPGLVSPRVSHVWPPPAISPRMWCRMIGFYLYS